MTIIFSRFHTLYGDLMLRRRLFLQIYATILAGIIAVAILTGVIWNLFGRDHINRDLIAITANLANLVLPGPEEPVSRQVEALQRLSEILETDLTLYDDQLRLIAATGEAAAPPRRMRSGWQPRRGGPSLNLQLDYGRWLVADAGRQRRVPPIFELALVLGVIGLTVGVVAYPVVRRLTRRLERLQKGVIRIGRGDFATRLAIQGSDEVAMLAKSFNDAAEKIEKLLGAHRLLLANASHELRTPLSRIRLGVVMLSEKEDPERREALNRDIAELDLLIDEILLMSRLDASVRIKALPVDLVALAAEECARYEHCSLSGKASEIRGDPDLLRRLIRNLLDNATDHGQPPVKVEITADADKATLLVSDGGKGVPEDSSEKVFAPFYRGHDRQKVAGYGLGLALVKQIAEAHGGQVSLLQRGARPFTIKVTLPLQPS